MIQKYKLIAIVFILILASCKSKKTIIDKNEVETEEIVINKKKTEEKKQSENKTENKEEKSVIDEWLKIESDKIIITEKDGTVTEIINPRIDKGKSENKESTTVNKKTTEVEEKTQTVTKDITHKETKTDVSEKHTSKPKEPIWLWIVAATFFGTVIFIVLRWFRLI